MTDQFITLLNKAPMFMKELIRELQGRCGLASDPQDDANQAMPPQGNPWEGLNSLPLRPYMGYVGLPYRLGVRRSYMSRGHK